MTDIDITDKEATDKPAVIALDKPRGCCEECKTNYPTIELLQTDLKSKEEKIRELTRHVHMLETDLPTTNKKRRYGDTGHDEMHEAMMNNSADKDIAIGNLKEEKMALIAKAKEMEATHNAALEALKKKNSDLSLRLIELERTSKIGSKNGGVEKQAETKALKQQVVLLTEKLEERETALDESLKALNEKDWNGNQQEKDPSVPSILSEMQKIIESKFSNLESTISHIVEKKLDEKQAAHSDNQKVTFAAMLSKTLENKTSTVENAIKASQNDERVMESERGKREKNIMIHGAIETNEPEKEKEFDEEYITAFMRILGTDVQPESITRLGNVSNSSLETSGRKRSRPIRLCMKTMADKETIMRRLSNLKNADEQYKRVSVKDDYSVEERGIIREWQAKADERNKEENTQSWKCRGNPKNGMRLVKIKTQEPASNTMGLAKPTPSKTANRNTPMQ